MLGGPERVGTWTTPFTIHIQIMKVEVQGEVRWFPVLVAPGLGMARISTLSYAQPLEAFEAVCDRLKRVVMTEPKFDPIN